MWSVIGWVVAIMIIGRIGIRLVEWLGKGGDADKHFAESAKMNAKAEQKRAEEKRAEHERYWAERREMEQRSEEREREWQEELRKLRDAGMLPVAGDDDKL